MAQSILYTASSGIWRTVWLEPVPDRHVTSVDVVPDIDASSLSMVVQGSDDAVGLDVKVAVSDKGKEVAASVGRVGRPFQVPHQASLMVWVCIPLVLFVMLGPPACLSKGQYKAPGKM